MFEKIQLIGIVLLYALLIFVAFKFLVRRIRSKYGALKTVKARVVDKHKTEAIVKYKGCGNRVRCVIVFEIDGKKKGFYVSEFSYAGYRLGESGTLKYRGDRIIDFS